MTGVTKPVEFNFIQALRVIVELIRVRAEQQGLKFRFQADHNLPGWIIADDTRLRQVLLNLLGNAVKFTQQGRIILEAGLSDGGQGRSRSITDDRGGALGPPVVGPTAQLLHRSASQTGLQ